MKTDNADRRKSKIVTQDGLLTRAAWLYYKDGLTQAEVASMLGVSRASVGRLLQRARDDGLVTITFNPEHMQAFSLGEELAATFDLDGALVIPELSGTSDRARINERLAQGAAEFLMPHLSRGKLLAIGWGDTVARTIAALDDRVLHEVELCTLTGGVSFYLETVLARRGQKPPDLRSATAHVIPTPIVTSSTPLAEALRDEPEVRRVLERSAAADFTLVGVGTIDRGATLVDMQYVSEDDIKAVERSGAVGDILGQFFDREGNVLDIPLHDRRIGIDISVLRERDNVVGVAGGLGKVEAILGALHGGYLDMLITDEDVAKELIARGSA